MRSRRPRNNNNPRQNLDSFLDILTNTVGVLMFIGLFVSLLAVEAGTIIRTPLRSETMKIGKFFEVRNNEVFYLNDPQLENKIDETVATIPNCFRPNTPENIPNYLYSFYIQEIEKYDRCIRNRNLSLEKFYYDNGDYIVTFTPQGSLKYQPNSLSQGDTIKDLRNTGSEFNRILNQLDPNVNYIAFVVRPDSFAAFRAARQIAWNSGYEVGWEPLPQDRVLVFGSGGRSVGVQ
jgi:hypothetical protein